MKKIILVLFIANILFSCQKDEGRLLGCRFVGITLQENYKQIVDKNGYKPYYPYLDVVMGDNLLFTTNCDTFIPRILVYDKDDNEIGYHFKKTDKECNFGIGTVKKVGERSYELHISPNNEDKYKIMELTFNPLSDEGYKPSSLAIFLDEDALQ